MKRILGVFIFILGLCLAAWIGYNLFIQRQPEDQVRSSIATIIMSLAFLFIGYKWMTGKRAG
jgi:hypothetical protein